MSQESAHSATSSGGRLSQGSVISVTDSEDGCCIVPNWNPTRFSVEPPPNAASSESFIRHLLLQGDNDCDYCDGATHRSGMPCLEGEHCGTIPRKKPAKPLSHGGVYRPRTTCRNCCLFTQGEYKLVKNDMVIALQKGEVLAVSKHFMDQFQVFETQTVQEREAYKDKWVANYVEDKRKRKQAREKKKRAEKKRVKRKQKRALASSQDHSATSSDGTEQCSQVDAEMVTEDQQSSQEGVLIQSPFEHASSVVRAYDACVFVARRTLSAPCHGTGTPSRQTRCVARRIFFIPRSCMNGNSP